MTLKGGSLQRSLAMSMLIEQSKLFGRRKNTESGSNAEDLVSRSTPDAEMRDRIRVLEKNAFDAAQASMISAACMRTREKLVEVLFLAVGILGAGGELTLKLTDWVPIAHFRTVWSASLLLLTLPMVKTAWTLCSGHPSLEVGFAEAAAQSRIYARLAAQFGRKLAEAQSAQKGDVPTALDWRTLVEDLEGIIGRVATQPKPTLVPERRHHRVVPREQKVVVKTRDGRRLTATIANLSVSGAALAECLPRVAVGERIIIGSQVAHVVRAWENGMGLQFEHEIEAARFNTDIVL